MKRYIRKKLEKNPFLIKKAIEKSEVLDYKTLSLIASACRKEYPGGVVRLTPQKNSSILFVTKATHGIKRELKKLCALFGWKGEIEVHYV